MSRHSSGGRSEVGASELATGLPHARHVVVTEVGHLWCLTAPDRFAIMLADFVESVPGGDA